jgi:hypothetical protein
VSRALAHVHELPSYRAAMFLAHAHRVGQLIFLRKRGQGF